MNSQKIEIAGPGFRYCAQVGRGLLADAGRLTREQIAGDRAFLITDASVPGSIVQTVASSLRQAGFDTAEIVIAAGDQSKCLAEVERVCGQMSTADRSSVVIAVGGGVVGDLAGFVAAIFHRGIPHVLIPTTLLAMVDSSIGGKTGVNLAAGKNLVGAFHQPVLVLSDVDVLQLLPAEQLRQGYAEIIKHAIILDAEMFRELEAAHAPEYVPLIARNIRIKAAVVAEDEREREGKRELLNFGHTVGHAIERASEYALPHGDCVSLGIVAACGISMKRAGFAREERNAVVELLGRYGLPVRLGPGVPRNAIFEAIARDKKFVCGEIRFVVAPRIGQAFVSHEVTLRDLRDGVEEL
ncbi:MAG: 3-dehydroquinate synthase [Verrucomicrobia bacterium]|nr:3-dehydroquinate synthase [Verrucomicrobiota bacterium]